VVATFVVRLIADRLSEGEFVGEVEHVASGHTATLRSADDLARFAAHQNLVHQEPAGRERNPSS
jgi:hypothetical protein